MPERINHQIIENYQTFKRVRYENKELSDDRIVLEDKKSNANYKNGTSLVKSNEVTDLQFVVEANKRQVKNYGFKLISKTLCDKPFFRFDAAGCAHNNKSPQNPLPLRQITTPHFQFYDELGYNNAYKTAELKDPKVVSELEHDINKGAELFCEESVTFTSENSYPNIERDRGLLFGTGNIDPLIDIKFDESL